jgi:acetoacetate decarboxylase
MGFKFEKDKAYQMPVYFGPSEVAGHYPMVYPYTRPADVEAISVIFETDPDKIDSLLPEGYTSRAPMLSVIVCEFANCGWLGGNTYYLINICTPVHFDGEKDHLDGDLVLVMYENAFTPIVGGRDNLGYSKIYCDIDRFRKPDYDVIKTSAYEWGFKFMDISIDLSKPAESAEKIQAVNAKSEGRFNLKYIPATGANGYDVCYSTFNPKTWTKPQDYPYNFKLAETKFCSGKVKFYAPQPEDIPRFWHIPAFLSKLPMNYLGAQHMIHNDACDYTHVYRLR